MKKISFFLNNKYSYSTLSNNEIKKIYFKKLFFLKKIHKIKKKKYNYKQKKNIHTTEFLNYLFCKKRISERENKILLKLYLKFNINLRLKKKYSKYLIKKTNNNCEKFSYLHLSLLIPRIKSISDVHKLNSILKINDMFTFSNFKKKEHINLFKHSLLNEIKYLKAL